MEESLKKLKAFRVIELKHVLHELGLSKQGNKKVLFDRIKKALSEGCAKKKHVDARGVACIVDDTYRKMQASVIKIRIKEEPAEEDDSNQMMNTMNKCTACGVLGQQHIGCAVVSSQSRLIRADPFSPTMANPLPPMQLIAARHTVGKDEPVLNMNLQWGLSHFSCMIPDHSSGPALNTNTGVNTGRDLMQVRSVVPACGSRGFRLFGFDIDIDIDIEGISMATCPASSNINGYTPGGEGSRSAAFVPRHPHQYS